MRNCWLKMKWKGWKETEYQRINLSITSASNLKKQWQGLLLCWTNLDSVSQRGRWKVCEVVVKTTQHRTLSVRDETVHRTPALSTVPHLTYIHAVLDAYKGAKLRFEYGWRVRSVWLAACKWHQTRYISNRGRGEGGKNIAGWEAFSPLCHSLKHPACVHMCTSVGDEGVCVSVYGRRLV